MNRNCENHSKAFPNGGIYILQSDRIFLTAINHKIGINGIGSHKHNDWLSFELCMDGQPIIIDPGTYSYTGNMEMRRLFRSTAYHNTVVIDGEEQVEIHNSMFGFLNPVGNILVTRWESNDTKDVLEAEHTGYCRLKNPVTHRRCFTLNKADNILTICDTFKSKGRHFFEWYFHLEPQLNAIIEGRSAKIFKNQKHICLITFQGQIGEPSILDGWISKAYNSRENSEIIRSACETAIEMEKPDTFLFSIKGK